MSLHRQLTSLARSSGPCLARAHAGWLASWALTVAECGFHAVGALRGGMGARGPQDGGAAGHPEARREGFVGAGVRFGRRGRGRQLPR
jgi:hypothetical protein